MPLSEDQANLLAAIAMTDAQIEAAEAGDPSAADAEVALLGAVAADPKQAAELFAQDDAALGNAAQGNAGVELANPPGHKQLRAPKGGIVLQGRYYVGGQYIPQEVLETLDSHEREDLEAGKGISSGQRLPPPGQLSRSARTDDTSASGDDGGNDEPIAAWRLFGGEDKVEAVYIEQGPEGHRWVARRDRSGLVASGEWSQDQKAAIRAGRAYAVKAMQA